ncbi:MAG: hypothetical protein M9894_11185 [Planctomycetes bacterium]|nr:hypothetical protein [Planctomycetota bacterium]
MGVRAADALAALPRGALLARALAGAGPLRRVEFEAQPRLLGLARLVRAAEVADAAGQPLLLRLGDARPHLVAALLADAGLHQPLAALLEGDLTLDVDPPVGPLLEGDLAGERPALRVDPGDLERLLRRLLTGRGLVLRVGEHGSGGEGEHASDGGRDEEGAGVLLDRVHHGESLRRAAVVGPSRCGLSDRCPRRARACQLGGH